MSFPVSTLKYWTFNPLLTTDGARVLIEAACSATKVLTGAVKPLKLGAYKNDPPLDATTVLADLEECDFTDYAQLTIDVTPPTNGPNGTPTLDIAAQFIGNGGTVTVPGQITGFFLLDNGGTRLVGVQRMDDPFAVVDPFDGCSVNVQLGMPGHDPILDP